MINIFKKNEIDMLNGSVVDKLLIFALPLAFTSILQQLFNAADIVVCGKFVGSIALASVGANAQILNLFVNCFIGLSVGVNVMVANYIGAGKNEKINNIVQTGITFAVLFGIILTFFGLMLSKNILIFLGTPDDIMDEAIVYLRILFLGMPFFVIYNFGAAILRSVGDTRRPLIILIFTGVLNVILNVILVVLFKLGVKGVAIATAFSVSVSAVIVIYLLTHEKGLIRYDIKKWFINLDALSKILRIGIPSAIQGMVFSISNLCVQSAVNSLGTYTIAANAAAINFENFPYFMLSSFGNACVTFFSQNFGAEKFDRCKRVLRDSIITSAICSILFTIIIQIFSKHLIWLFTDEEEVIKIAMVRINTVGKLIWIECLYDNFGAALRAMKHPMIPPIMVILGTVVFRIIWCTFVFPLYNTYLMVAIVYPISWVIIDIGMTIAYVIVSRKALKPIQVTKGNAD